MAEASRGVIRPGRVAPTAALLLVSSIAAAQTYAPLLRVDRLEGAATATRSGHAIGVTPGYAVAEHDTVRVDAGSRMVLSLGTASGVDLGPSSSVVVEKLPDGTTKGADLSTRFRIEKGMLHLSWRSTSPNEWPPELYVGDWQIRASLGEFFVQADGDHAAIACSAEGTLRVLAITSDAEERVGADACVRLVKGKPTKKIALAAGDWTDVRNAGQLAKVALQLGASTQEAAAAPPSAGGKGKAPSSDKRKAAAVPATPAAPAPVPPPPVADAVPAVAPEPATAPAPAPASGSGTGAASVAEESTGAPHPAAAAPVPAVAPIAPVAAVAPVAKGPVEPVKGEVSRVEGVAPARSEVSAVAPVAPVAPVEPVVVIPSSPIPGVDDVTASRDVPAPPPSSPWGGTPAGASPGLGAPAPAPASAAAAAAPPAQPAGPEWVVNVMAFPDPNSAEQQAQKLKGAGYVTTVRQETVRGRASYRLVIAGIDSEDTANKIVKDLGERYGLTTAWALQRR